MALLFAVPANAQLLAETGTTVQVGALHQQLAGLMGGAAGALASPGWRFTPALGVQESWTDHLLGSDGTGKSSFITTFTPSALINGQTTRTNTTISYAPSLQYYSNGSQTLINQNLNAASQITVLPERLFLDLRGFAAVQPTYGGYGPSYSGYGSSGTTALSGQNQSQTLGFSAHPYLRQSLGDLGSAELGATLSYASQNSLASNQTSGQSPLNTTLGGGQNYTSEQEYFSLASGSALGRTSAGLLVSASQDSGSGVMNNAYRNQAVMNLGYAITRSLTALAVFGYDDVHYGGTPPYNYSGPQWSGGARWVPNPDSSITVLYGSLQGVQSVQLDASYAPTARTRVYARYSEGISSGLQQLLSGMNGSTLDPMGNPVNRATNTPVQLGGGFYGTQNNLAQVTNASVTATLLRDRDAFSVTFSRQQSHQLAAASAADASNLDSTGWYGTLSWQRDLWVNLNASTFVQVGTNQYTTVGAGQNYDTLVFGLSLSYVVSRTVNAYAQYSWTRQGYPTSGGSIQTLPTNLIVFGASKSF